MSSYPNSRRAHRVFACGLPFLAALALTGALAQPDRALRLAERLVAWPDSGDVDIALLPGAIPDDLGLALPLPAGGELLGSLVWRHANGRLLSVQAVADSPLTSDATFAFFRAAFELRGWLVRTDPRPAGFVASQTTLGGQFCAPDGKLFMFVHSFYRPDAPTDVRLDISPAGSHNPCGSIFDTELYDPQLAPMPALVAPAVSELFVHSSAPYEWEASSLATITTELSPQRLRDHYHDQLAATGWQPHADGSWRLNADDVAWTGLFDAVPLPGGPNRYALTLVVARLQ